MIKFFVKMFAIVMFRVKHKKDMADFPKLIDVVMSCETPEQCTTAMHYIRLYRLRYAGNNSAFSSVTKTILDQLISYLQDHAEHVKQGWHKPAWNGYATVSTYPDMNDYIGKVINVRFKKSWVRGVPCVIPG